MSVSSRVISRRTLLTGISTLGLGASAAVGQSPTDAAIGRELKLDDPASNLEAYIKLRGDLSGETVYDMVRGRVFGLVAGQAARPLFKMVGAQRSRYTRASSLEYHMASRYVGILLDWHTEKPLQSWLNPYTEKACQVPATKYGPSRMRLLSDGMFLADAGPETPPHATRPWFVMGDIVHMVDQIVSPVAQPLRPDADLMTFSGSARALGNPQTTRIPSQLNFTAVESWREWMQMQQTGSLWWHVAGVKLDGAADYPDEILAELGRLDPDFFARDSL
jgi:hypothetical protein